MSPTLSRRELFFIEAIGWTLTALSVPFGAAFIGLVIDGMLVPR